VSELTTTSYAILSLLGVRSWTTYELAQQMERSVGSMWPRAASVVYEEPKRLVREGLATVSTRRTGRRPSSVYAITLDGREALARWLSEPGGSPTLEFEGMLKVAFADQGSLEGLRTNLTAIRANVQGELAEVERRRKEYAEWGGPYPERLPVIALALRFYQEQAEARLRWVEWATAAASKWSGVTPETGAHVPLDAFAQK
jgi:DNA-binding PadR family transcriptional regulator